MSSDREARKLWQKGQPRRCEINQVGPIGECLACDAEQGVACLKPKHTPAGESACDHKHWNFREHGRVCTCGKFMADFGD